MTWPVFLVLFTPACAITAWVLYRHVKKEMEEFEAALREIELDLPGDGSDG